MRRDEALRITLASLVSSACWCGIAIAISGQGPVAEPAAELLIRVLPPAGETQPVRLENAQLLLAWWGYTEEVPLAHRYEAGELVVIVPLNREVLSSLGEMPPPDFAYLYLEFDGFVPVRSEKFYWLGGRAPTGPRESWETVTEAQFRFRGGPPVAIRHGERRDVSLQVRRPVAKHVRFIDDLGRPFSGITVDGGVFWSMNNHCGYPGGLKPLFADRRPDEDGVVTVPDGDVEYGFRVNGDDHSSIIGGESHDPTFVTTFIDAPERLVRIRRHPRVPLTMRVSIGGTAAPEVMVSAWVATACMNGTGALGQTNDRGVLHVPDFYPEEFDAVCIGGCDGHSVWSAAAPTRGELTIDLPAATKVGDVQYCYPTHAERDRFDRTPWD